MARAQTGGGPDLAAARAGAGPHRGRATAYLADRGELARLKTDLVELAERTDPLRLAEACRRLRMQAAPQLAAGDDWSALQARSLSISRSFAGPGVLDATLDPDSAETVMRAIHAFAAPGPRPLTTAP